jgi:hypothetical protein
LNELRCVQVDEFLATGQWPNQSYGLAKFAKFGADFRPQVPEGSRLLPPETQTFLNATINDDHPIKYG